jgi:hypothetical protein
MPNLTPCLPRFVSLAGGTICALVGREVLRHAEQTGRLSTGGLVTLSGAAVAGLLLVLAALAPAMWWMNGRARALRLLDGLRAADEWVASVGGGLLIISGGVGLAAMLAIFFPLQQDPWDDDQGAFLITAREVHDAGGVGWLLGALLRGEFAEANRHPLYLALLSFRPTFEGGKWLSAAIGVLSLVVLTRMMFRRHGALAAGLFCVLLATNYEFCFHATRVVCEVLIVLLSGVLWLLHVPVRCANRAEVLDGPAPPAESATLRQAAVAGALLGLLYLTKGTGLVLCGGYFAWQIARCWSAPRATSPDKPAGVRTAGCTWKSAGLAMLVAACAFLAVSAPLLVRNVRRFGNPFYNINSLLLFADEYPEIERLLREGTTTGEAARQFFATHTVVDLVRREVSGLVWETFLLLRSLGPAPLDDSRVLFGLPLAALAALTMLALRRPADGLLLIWTVLHWLVFAWYVPIAASERFLLPLLVPLLAAAAVGLVRLAASVRAAAVAWLPWLALAWTAAWVAATYYSSTLAERLGDGAALAAR